MEVIWIYQLRWNHQYYLFSISVLVFRIYIGPYQCFIQNIYFFVIFAFKNISGLRSAPQHSNTVDIKAHGSYFDITHCTEGWNYSMVILYTVLNLNNWGERGNIIKKELISHWLKEIINLQSCQSSFTISNNIATVEQYSNCLNWQQTVGTFL